MEYLSTTFGKVSKLPLDSSDSLDFKLCLASPLPAFIKDSQRFLLMRPKMKKLVENEGERKMSDGKCQDNRFSNDNFEFCHMKERHQLRHQQLMTFVELNYEPKNADYEHDGFEWSGDFDAAPKPAVFYWARGLLTAQMNTQKAKMIKIKDKDKLSKNSCCL
uniref:Uncharacterized protein n=1 Tax=Romanomermis culicivorax TaxID=13658 RepID=A0A915I833_ROMCU